MNRFKILKERYWKELFENILPFWVNYAIDESGAVNNCITETGEVISRDRYYWGQGRALWTFAKAYDLLKDDKLLTIATNLFKYIEANGFDENGCCVYLTDENGKVTQGAESIHSDAFVLYGISEYYRVSGSSEAYNLALQIYESTALRLKDPKQIKTFPFNTPDGLQAHSVHMVFAHLYYKTGLHLNNDKIRRHGLKMASELPVLFFNGQKNALMEYCVYDSLKAVESYEYLDIYNPGHGIEAMWFLMDIWDSEQQEIPEIVYHILRYNLECGWDKQYGGIMLEGRLRKLIVDYSRCPDKKPGWSHCEAMVATLYAYLLTGEDYWLEWHKKIDEFTFRVFPNHNKLEWKGWMNRACTKQIAAQENLNIKCNFHIPRALMMQINLCDKIIQKML